jgi:hypothetical protein
MQCGFTKQHYFDCLTKAQDLGYEIKPVKDYDVMDDKVILLRHDIDYSLDYAHKLATWENRFGIKSSYYIHLHSETYNALEPRSLEIIRKIHKLGHEIGFHYDAKYHIPTESLFVSKIVDGGKTQMESYTLHNASTDRLNMRFYHLKYPNEWDLKYISESGRNWREGCMCKWIGKVNKLLILLHPLWWVNEGVRDKVMHEVVELAKKNLDKGRDNYLKVLRKYCEDLGIEY